MPVFAQKVVLGFHDTRQTAHQHTAFTGQIAIDLIGKRGREKISGPDGDAEGQSSFFGPAGIVLLNRKAGINATAV